MTIELHLDPPTAAGEHVSDPDTEANLCEVCYDMIVSFGLENVLSSMGRAARVRASDYMWADRHQYLRHHRASSRILAAYQEIAKDAEQVDRIVEEERVHAESCAFCPR